MSQHTQRRSRAIRRQVYLVLAAVALTSMFALAADNDNDGMDDAYEAFFGLNTNSAADAALNYDGDSLVNSNESLLWTDPWREDTDNDGFPDHLDSNALSRAYMDFGNPCSAIGDEYVYTGPGWWISALQTNGAWNTNAPSCWHVPCADTNAASLYMHVNAGSLTNRMALELGLVDWPGSSLYIDLLDTNMSVVATNMFGNILKGSGATNLLCMPLGTNAEASCISLRRGSGNITVFDGMLYIDADGDRFDSDQEIQKGTSEALIDSDSDGYIDSVEHSLGYDPADSRSCPFTNWPGKMKLYFRDTANTLEDMPVLVTLTPDRVSYTEFTKDGSDLRFDDPLGEELDHEIALWNTNGTSYVWVRVTRLSDSIFHNYFLMHWGNSSASNSANSAGVWTNEYAGVWHMEEGDGSIGDSSSGGHEGLNDGTLSVPGKLGFSRDFNHKGSILMPAEVLSGIDKKVTFSFWQYIPEERRIGGDILLEAANENGCEFLIACPYANEYIYWMAYGNYDYTVKKASESQYKGGWNYWTFTKDSQTGVMDIYHNGELWQHSTGKTRTYSPVTRFRLGSYSEPPGWGPYCYRGMVDEFFVSTTARTPEWINAQYRNMNDDWLVYGGETVEVQGTRNGSELGTNALFTVCRSGAYTNLPVTVNYTVSGNATAGLDYTNNLSGEVVIHAGTTQALITVGVMDDDRFEGAETVVVSLTKGNYMIDPSAASGTVSILDGDADSDSDGMSDDWETVHFGDLSHDGAADGDVDGLTDLEEYQNGADPNDSDTDDDTLSDGDEVDTYGTDPDNIDSDSDGMPDKWEIDNSLNPSDASDAAEDGDGDGLLNKDECSLGLDPNQSVHDSDGDTLGDAEETYLFGTDALTADSNSNGVNDAVSIVEWDGAATIRRNGEWTESDGVLQSLANRRMRFEYACELTADGMYRLGLEITNTCSSTSTKQTYRIQVMADGTPFAWFETDVDANTSVWDYVATPWLAAGRHTFRFAWLDDYSDAKELGVIRAVLQDIDAPDSDSDGRQDWVESILALENDTDLDSLSDISELDSSGTDPVLKDSDAGLTCNWTFGDSQSSTNPAPVHTYAGSGVYTAEVGIADGAGGTVRATNIISLADPGWTDGFENYTCGSQLHGQGGWKGWDNNSSYGALVSSNAAYTGDHSVRIVGNSDLVHEYSGYTSGQWTYITRQYIPTSFSGRQYFILLNRYNDGGSKRWATQVYFDANRNKVHSDFDGNELSLIKGQWVEIRVEIDLDADTQRFYYNGSLLVQKSWRNGVSSGGDKAIRAVDLFAYTGSAVYYDDIALRAGGSNGNLSPVALNQNAATVEDIGKIITLAASDYDGDSLSYAIVTNALHGSLRHDGSSSKVIYVPTNEYTGTDSFSFTVHDGSATSGVGTVDIRVLPRLSASVSFDAVPSCSDPLSVAFSPLAWGPGLDGDTLSDWEEPAIFNTDPLVIDSDGDGTNDAFLVKALDGVDTVARPAWHSISQWKEDGTVLYHNGRFTSCRAVYEITIDKAGIYRIGLQMRSFEDQPDNFHFLINLFIDDDYVGTFDVPAEVGLSRRGYVTTPWLEPGTYRLALRKQNNGYASNGRYVYPMYEKLVVYALDASSTDDNTNGIPDWAEAHLDERADSDKDGISDYDEVVLYNTNPMDPDSDNDGLLDGKEAYLGTDPDVMDTDGDGMGDGWEYRVNSDPFTRDFTNVVSPVAVIDITPSETNAVEGEWEVVTNNCLEACGRRGSASYGFNASTPFIYALKVTGIQGSSVSDIRKFKILAYIDGEYLGYDYIDQDGAGAAYFVTPWLTNGAHNLKLHWDGAHDNCRLRLTEITLTAYDGPDTDGNGLVDWIDNRLDTIYGIDPIAATNVSPLCVEGNGRFFNGMSAALDDSPVTLKHGAGHRWYTDVSLCATASVQFVLSVEHGIRTYTNNLSWDAVNLLYSGDMAVRKDDTLLLSAVPAGATNGTVEVEIVGVTNYTTDVDTPVEHTFDSNGVFTVTGSHDNGSTTSNSIQVTAIEAAFPEDAPAVWWGGNRKYENPDIPAEGVEIEHDEYVHITRMEPRAGGGIQYYLGISEADDQHYLLARLENGGAVCDSVKIDACWLVTNPGFYLHCAGFLEDGTMITEARITVGYLPEDCQVKLSVMSGGSTFENGATVVYVDADDLTETGEYVYKMYTPPGEGLMCQKIQILENGTAIGPGWTE